MLKPFLKIFNGNAKKKRASVPDGERVYVIGDIHGRLDLFDALVRAMDGLWSHCALNRAELTG